jgi:phosphatidate cytidylyltransferase
MTLRILTGIVLIIVFGAALWFLPTPQLLVIAEAVLVLGFVEYERLAGALGVRIPAIVACAASMLAAASLGLSYPLELPLLAALLAVGAVIVGSREPGPTVLADVAAAMFPVLYLGLPLGALVALHATGGREAVLLLIATIIVSDTAQLGGGMLLGRHKLSPVISPKKTVEGALTGFVVAPAVMLLLSRWWLPQAGSATVLLLGLFIVGLGIAGDLFESLLKRSAGVKDSSALIPGHGGVLDRIDSLLFAAPGFYLFVKYGL